jgi:hypothetical protein
MQKMFSFNQIDVQQRFLLLLLMMDGLTGSWFVHYEDIAELAVLYINSSCLLFFSTKAEHSRFLAIG